MMRRSSLTLVAVCAAAATLPWTSPADGATPGHSFRVAGSSAQQVAGIAWHHCKGLGERYQCAAVAVPLNWHRPNGAHIRLAVIRFVGSDQAHRIGSMFVNPGGPGSSGVAIVRGLGPELAAWGRGRFDVVGWDPRGTNASDPVRCFPTPGAEARFWHGAHIPMTPAQSRAFARRAAELARRCGRVSRRLLDNISTEDTVRDLDHLRRLVGDRALTYVGFSYGSLIGQTYENMFPRRVRAMLLDGIADPV